MQFDLINFYAHDIMNIVCLVSRYMKSVTKTQVLVPRKCNTPKIRYSGRLTSFVSVTGIGIILKT